METFYKSNDVWENVFKLNFCFNLYETRSLLCSFGCLGTGFADQGELELRGTLPVS